jgi:5'-phosphate synthase pdxT subunit
LVTTTIGVLALQGDFAAHAAMFDRMGAQTVEVRQPAALDDLDGIVLPGGESTTMSMLLERSGILAPLTARIAGGLPTLGTCAGLILLGREIVDGRPDQHAIGAIDITSRRNAYGTQIQSFETDISVKGFDRPFHAVFIRAPMIERVGAGVEVLATIDDQPVLCQQDHVTVAAFHPELSGDDRIHRRFLAGVGITT